MIKSVYEYDLAEHALAEPDGNEALVRVYLRQSSKQLSTAYKALSAGEEIYDILGKIQRDLGYVMKNSHARHSV